MSKAEQKMLESLNLMLDEDEREPVEVVEEEIGGVEEQIDEEEDVDLESVEEEVEADSDNSSQEEDVAGNQSSSEEVSTEESDFDYVETFKELYGEDIGEKSQPYETYLDQVESYKTELVETSNELVNKKNQLVNGLNSIPDEFKTYNGKFINELTRQEAVDFQQKLYDDVGEDAVAKFKTALHFAEQLDANNKSMVEFNQAVDSYEWEKVFSDLVTKTPALYQKQKDIHKRLEEKLQQVQYKPNDLEFKKKLFKSVLKDMAHNGVPPKKAKQTPEAEIKPSTKRVTTPKKSSPSLDELADQVLSNEVSLFGL